MEYVELLCELSFGLGVFNAVLVVTLLRRGEPILLTKAEEAR